MNRVSSVLGAAAVVAVAVVFVMGFRPDRGTTLKAGPTCAAEVRGDCIPADHFNAALRFIAPRGMDAARMKAMGLRRLVAEGLVERWLLNQDAKRLGVTVSDEDLTAELAAGRVHVSLPGDKLRELAHPMQLNDDLVRLLPTKNRQTKKFDAKLYETQIKQVARVSPQVFREFQREELIAARMRDLVRSRVRVGDAEAFEQFARDKSTATLSYVRFDREFFKDVALDPKGAEAWAALHKEDLDKAWDGRKAKYGECRKARHILVKSDEHDEPADRQAAKAKLEAAIERVKKGEDFAAVARETSQDGSAAEGGDLGCVTKDQMVKPFEEALFALEGKGALSGVVETQFGYHVIKLDDVLKGADAEALGRKLLVEERYLQEESERLAAEGAKEVLAAARGGKPLEEAVSAYLAKLPKKPEPDGKKDKDKGKKDKDKKDKPAGDTPAAAAAPTAENHPDRPTVDTTLPFNATGEPLSGVMPGTNLAQIGFSLEKPGDLPPDIVPLRTGYAVVQLKEKTPASQEQWAKDREYYLGAMRGAKQADALAGYVRRLRSQLATDVKYMTDVIGDPKTTDGPAPDPSEDEP